MSIERKYRDTEIGSVRNKLSIRVKTPEIPVNRRRTLMISEQNNFQLIKRLTHINFPKKRFKAIAPNEYSKHVLRATGVLINSEYCAKYSYPDSVLSIHQLEMLKTIDTDNFCQLKSKAYNAVPRRLKTLIINL